MGNQKLEQLFISYGSYHHNLMYFPLYSATSGSTSFVSLSSSPHYLLWSTTSRYSKFLDIPFPSRLCSFGLWCSTTSTTASPSEYLSNNLVFMHTRLWRMLARNALPVQKIPVKLFQKRSDNSCCELDLPVYRPRSLWKYECRNKERRPALLDNVAQVLSAPLFVVIEVVCFFAMGDFKKSVEPKI